MYPWNEWPWTNVHQLNLDWVIRKLRETIEYLKSLKEEVDQHGEELEKINGQIAELEQFVEDFKAGKFDGLYLELIQKWTEENLPEIIAKIVKYVMFGLSTDGYFIACIPDTWDFIQFDTVMDITSDLYGHLVLRW